MALPTGWGFSNWDMVANVTGAGLFIGQDLGWGEQQEYESSSRRI